MVAFVRAAGRIVVRRLIDDWLMLTVLTVTVLAAMVQLAAAPMYRDAVTTGAMQRILANAPAADTTILVETRAAPEHYAEIDTTVFATEEGATAGVGSMVTRRLTSASSYDLRSDSSKPIVMSLSAPVGIEDHAGLLDGVWPSPEQGDGNTLEAAISLRAADELGVAVGDELRLNDRRTGHDFTARLVGVFEVSDPTSPFWLDDDLLTVGVSETLSTTAVGPLVVDPSVLLGESGAIQPARLVATWLIEPRLDRLTVDAVDDLRRSLNRLPDELERASGGLSPEATATTSAFDVTSLLPELLLDTNRSLAVTRSGLYAVVAQLALLAALALAIAAGLLIDTRRRETTLLEARGISRRQLITFALLEAAVLVVPVAVVAPWVAAALLRLVGRFGPLATIDLAVDAPVNREALITVGIAAVITIVLLAWPSVRATTSITNPLSHHRRQRVRQLTQSLGIDVALLALTAVAFWQLRAISSTPVGRLADRFSVDPVLVVTPALGLLTGAVLTLRIVPLMARTGERLATAGRSVVGALTGWQLARRPGGQARAAFLLVMAISIGFFAASYAATWNDSQADQADFQVGADLRVLPNRRTNDSITDLHLTAAHQRLDAVEASMPLQRIVGSLPGSDRRGTFLLLDAAKAADIVSLRPDGAPEFAALMDELVASRPRLPGLAVPGEPERLRFTVDAFEEPIDVDDPRVVAIFDDDLPVEDDGGFLPPAFDGAVDIVVQDGDGFLHRLPAGTIEPNVGPTVLTVELTEAAGADLTLTPTYPLTIVDLQIRGTAPLFISRAVTVELLGIDAVDATGAASTIALTPSDGGSWIPSTLTLGRSTGQPTLAVAATDQRVTLDLDTAASDLFSTAQFLFSARPGRWSVPDAFPVVVSRRWLVESRTEIGDDLSLSTIRALDDTAVVVGAVDVFPTVDPITDHAVIVDLPTVQMVDYEPGRPIRGADENWLAVEEAGPTAVTAALSAQPFDSVAVEGRQRRYVSLTTDPAALATIGAFAIGFVVAAVFAVLVFVAVTAVSARERRDEFTLLRAFGLGPRQFVTWMATEQLVMVALGIVLGVAVGFGLSAAVLPLISIGQQGAPAVPPVEPRYPWATIALVVLAPPAALVATIVVTALRRERDSLGSRLRDGTT